MRILVFSFIENKDSSGMGKWTHRLTRGLVERGWKVTSWYREEFALCEKLGRLAVLLHPILFAIKLYTLREKPYVAIVHEPSGYWVGLLNRITGGGPKLVLMCHNVESKCSKIMKVAAELGVASEGFKNTFKFKLFRRWQGDGAIRLSDRVWCLSEEDRNYIVDELCVPESRVRRLTNGSDWTFGAKKSEPSLNTSSVLFIGGWLDVKGRMLLPKIWREIKRANTSARLTLVGVGCSSEEVLESFEPSNRRDIVVHPKVENPEAMTAIFQEHDILLMPSLTEGSPLSLIEAMSHGIVPVATCVGGIKDIVTHGEQGFLFDLSDQEELAVQSVLLLMKDSRLRNEMSGRAFERGNALTWDRFCEETDADLREMAQIPC